MNINSNDYEIERRFLFRPSENLLKFFESNCAKVKVHYLHSNKDSQIRVTYNKPLGYYTYTIKIGHGLKRKESEECIKSSLYEQLTEGIPALSFKYLKLNYTEFTQNSFILDSIRDNSSCDNLNMKALENEFIEGLCPDYYDIKLINLPYMYDYETNEFFLVEKEFNSIKESEKFRLPSDFLDPIEVTENPNYEMVNIYNKVYC